MIIVRSLIVPIGLAVAIAVSLPSTARAAGPSMETKLLASNCFVCHGPAGKSAAHTPEIASLTSAKIIDTMARFRDGSRVSTIMNRIAKGYTEAQIQAIAGYIGQ